jgi:hypothetical protein
MKGEQLPHSLCSVLLAKGPTAALADLGRLPGLNVLELLHQVPLISLQLAGDLHPHMHLAKKKSSQSAAVCADDGLVAPQRSETMMWAHEVLIK